MVGAGTFLRARLRTTASRSSIPRSRSGCSATCQEPPLAVSLAGRLLGDFEPAGDSSFSRTVFADRELGFWIGSLWGTSLPVRSPGEPFNPDEQRGFPAGLFAVAWACGPVGGRRLGESAARKRFVVNLAATCSRRTFTLQWFRTVGRRSWLSDQSSAGCWRSRSPVRIVPKNTVSIEAVDPSGRTRRKLRKPPGAQSCPAEKALVSRPRKTRHMPQLFDALLIVSFGMPERTPRKCCPFGKRAAGQECPARADAGRGRALPAFRRPQRRLNDQNRRPWSRRLRPELAAHGPQVAGLLGQSQLASAASRHAGRNGATGHPPSAGLVHHRPTALIPVAGNIEEKYRRGPACRSVPSAPEVHKLRAFFNHPRFIAAQVDRVREALAADSAYSRVAGQHC